MCKEKFEVQLFTAQDSLLFQTKKVMSEQSSVRVSARADLWQDQPNLIREAMIKGYVEMSSINLSIASECLYAEYEAQHTVERLVSGG